MPLARELSVETDRPTRLRVAVDDGEGGFVVSFPELATTHVVPILGLGAAREYDVSVRLVDAEGRIVDAPPLPVSTAALPEWFPTVDVLRLDRERVEAGVRLLPLEVPDGRFWLAALDASTGEVVWLYDGPVNWGDVRMTDHGTLLGLFGGGLEMDLLGRVLTRWTALPVEPTDVAIPWSKLHHELYPLPDGTFASLGYDTVSVPAYPVSYDDPTPAGPADVQDTRVVKFAADGTALADWSMAERLDTARIGFDSLDLLSDGYDWCHGNAVIPIGDDGSLLVVLRHQDALVKLDPDGEVGWILGDPAGWTAPVAERLLAPSGPLSWPYHPHGPSIDAQGRVVVFDNGSYGHTPYGPEPSEPVESRVVAFEVDATAGTVAQVWEWRPPDGPLVSNALGNAQVLPTTGNVLAGFSFLDGEDGVPNSLVGRGRKSVRMIELVPGEPEAVSDLRLWLPIDVEPEGVKAYRTVAAPSLYGPEVTVTLVEP